MVEDRIQELIPPALELVRYPFTQVDEFPYGIEEDELVEYAYDKGTRRLSTIESAKEKTPQEIEGDYEPYRLEERFGEEDAEAFAEAAAE